MLRLVENLGNDVIQRLKIEMLATRFFQAEMQLLNKDEVRVATNYSENSALVFYARCYMPQDDYPGISQLVIFYGPGRSCQEPEKFSSEMLRVFYRKPEYLNLFYDYYLKIVKKRKLHYVKL